MKEDMENYMKKMMKFAVIAISATFAIAIIVAAFTVVPTGYTGVRTTFGQVSSTAVPSGFNLKIPFVQNIVLVNNKLQDTTIQSQVWGESSEKTPVYADDIVVAYKVSSERSTWLITNITDYENVLTDSLVSSAIKNAMVELTADEVTIRSKIEPLVLTKLQESVDEKYGEGLVYVSKVTINQMDFEESYNAAIAEKSIARQTQEKQAIENKTSIDKAAADKEVAITKAEATAQEKKIAAEAEAAAMKIAAEAEAEAIKIKSEAEAEANEKKNASLTDSILRQEYIERWDGDLPEYVGSDSNILVDLTK